MVNLIAKVSVVLYFSIKCSQTDNCHLQAFISFFYHQCSKPRAAEPEKPVKRGGRTKQQPPEELPVNGTNDPDLVSVPEPTPEEAEMCVALEGADPDDAEGADIDKTIHNKQAVASVRTEVVAIAKIKYKMELNSEEAQTALGLFPKVCLMLSPGGTG